MDAENDISLARFQIQAPSLASESIFFDSPFNPISIDYHKSMVMGIQHGEIHPYRMNIIAVSLLHRRMYIAFGSTISSIKIFEDGTLDESSSSTFASVSPCTFKVEDWVTYTDATMDEENLINSIKVFQVSGEGDEFSRGGLWNPREFLLAVDMEGKVSIFDLASDSQNAVLILDNRFSDEIDNSTWGVDTFSSDSQVLIACGSNAHKITIWDVTSALTSSTIVTPTKQVIDGIHHNIPAVSFSPCGKFLAAASIDTNIRIFDVNTCDQLGQTSINDWAWSVQWALKENTRNYQGKVSSNNPLAQYLLICSGKAHFVLVDPVPNSSSGSNLGNMIKVDKIDFGIDRHFRYRVISRYSLVHYDVNANIAIATPQNTPLVHCFQISYHTRNQQFVFEKIDADFDKKVDVQEPVIASTLVKLGESTKHIVDKPFVMISLSHLRRISVFKFTKAIAEIDQQTKNFLDFEQYDL